MNFVSLSPSETMATADVRDILDVRREAQRPAKKQKTVQRRPGIYGYLATFCHYLLTENRGRHTRSVRALR